MKAIFTIFLLIFSLNIFAQHGPPADCLCNGTTSGKGKFYAGIGPDFHLASFENDDRRYSISTLGLGVHLGYNFNKSSAIELNTLKYSFTNIQMSSKSISNVQYSYLDFNLSFLYRFMKNGSRFIPYFKGGYLMNNTLKKKFESDNQAQVQNGFDIQGHYFSLNAGSLFILANQFTLYADAQVAATPSMFKGLYTDDVFRMKTMISVGVNYHF